MPIMPSLPKLPEMPMEPPMPTVPILPFQCPLGCPVILYVLYSPTLKLQVSLSLYFYILLPLIPLNTQEMPARDALQPRHLFVDLQSLLTQSDSHPVRHSDSPA